MKIAFCTCVQIGLSCIEAIIAEGGKFDLFLTLHDHKSKIKSGRIYLDEIAIQTNTPLYKTNHINDGDVVDVLRRYEIDWLFLIGWSQIASPNLIRVPRKGVIGAHPTLLPKGRGRAAVPWAIIKGLDKTGVSFFKMDEGVDTGDILDKYEIPIALNETATMLYDKVNLAHIHLIKQIWPKLIADSLIGIKQDESLASYWDGRTPDDGELFPYMNVDQVDRLVRATTRPYPGAFIKEFDQKCIIWTGKPGEHQGKVIKFADGNYTATEFEYV